MLTPKQAKDALNISPILPTNEIRKDKKEIITYLKLEKERDPFLRM